MRKQVAIIAPISSMPHILIMNSQYS